MPARTGPPPVASTAVPHDRLVRSCVVRLGVETEFPDRLDDPLGGQSTECFSWGPCHPPPPVEIPGSLPGVLALIGNNPLSWKWVRPALLVCPGAWEGLVLSCTQGGLLPKPGLTAMRVCGMIQAEWIGGPTMQKSRYTPEQSARFLAICRNW